MLLQKSVKLFGIVIHKKSELRGGGFRGSGFLTTVDVVRIRHDSIPDAKISNLVKGKRVNNQNLVYMCLNEKAVQGRERSESEL
jgi:hypothetical protein